MSSHVSSYSYVSSNPTLVDLVVDYRYKISWTNIFINSWHRNVIPEQYGQIVTTNQLCPNDQIRRFCWSNVQPKWPSGTAFEQFQTITPKVEPKFQQFQNYLAVNKNLGSYVMWPINYWHCCGIISASKIKFHGEPTSLEPTACTVQRSQVLTIELEKKNTKASEMTCHNLTILLRNSISVSSINK